MADNFGLKIGLEGEKEFKKALADINQSFKVLGSEMKVVESQFGKNDNSVEALTARNQVLNKEIEAQKQKIETLRSALENASSSFGYKIVNGQKPFINRKELIIILVNHSTRTRNHILE